MKFHLFKHKKQSKLNIKRLLLMVTVLFITTTVCAQINVQITNQPLRKALLKIEQNSDYHFFFSEKLKALDHNLTINVQNQPIEKVLNLLLQDTNIIYHFREKKLIVLSLKDKQYAPLMELKGKIVDSRGESIIGANVIVKGSNTGTITDFDGNFSMQIPKKAVIEITYIGFISRTISVENRSYLNVILQEDTQALDEVVVVGYGTQKKVNLTGSVETIGSKIIANRPINSVSQALQGNALGITVNSSSGRPGDFASIKVRGATSLNSAGALVLIDGMPGSINKINPQDIESISILKDAASSAIYGARAAEGVILITTKEGSSEKTKVEYSANFSFNSPTRIPESTTAAEHARLSNLAFTNAGSAPLFSREAMDAISNPDISELPNGNEFIYTSDVNWIDKMMDHSFHENHNLTVSRAQKNLKYRLSAGWLDQDGMFSEYGPDNYDRYNIRSNVNFEMIKNVLNFDSRISFTRSDRKYHPKFGGWTIPYIVFIQCGPNMPVYDQNGNYARYRMQGNPIEALKEGGEGKDIINTTEGIFTLTYKPTFLSGFSLKAIGGARYISNAKKEWRRAYGKFGPKGLISMGAGQRGPNNIKMWNSNSKYYTGQLLAEYKRTFASYEVDILGGTSAEISHYENLYGSRTNIIGNELPALNLGSTEGWTNAASESEWAMLSAFTRINYAYKAKYLFEANFRADGSSRFSSKNKWGYFPSFSVGWRLTEEPFMKNQTLFDNIKIRASWGQLGNQNGLGLYDHIAQYDVNGYYPFQKELAQWATLKMLPSEDRTWETIEMSNIALDIAFLNNRLTATAEYYIKRNKDMLVNLELPSIIGVKVPTGNYGELKVTGWEASIGWQDNKDDYSYFVKLNLADHKDKLVDYGVDFTGFKAGVNQKIEGYSIGSIFGYQADGYFQTSEEAKAAPAYNRAIQDAGDLRYVDQDKDGKISAPNDLVYLGTTQPRYEFGINLGGTWKNFDCSLLIQGVGKKSFYLSGVAFQPFRDSWSNYSFSYFGDYWTPENPNALLPRLYAGVKHNYQYSSKWVQNAAYARLKNVQVGYTISSSLTKKIKLNKVRVYASGENLWEYSKLFKYYDPELNSAGGYMYPIMRNYSIGLNITF